MEHEEIKMSEKESMELIASMINKAKNRVSESGTLYLLWGWLILACCLVQFAGLHFFHYEKVYFIWYATWLLVIYQFFYLSKRRKARTVKTYTNEITVFVWIVFFICMMLAIFIGIQFRHYEMIDPLLLVLYGMPTFLSGIIFKFKPLVIGGICCWVFATFSPFVPVDYQLLLLAAAVISAWIVPGYLLKENFKKEK
jgi:ABC-type proline/glycine betaine transport system permease subunit